MIEPSNDQEKEEDYPLSPLQRSPPTFRSCSLGGYRIDWISTGYLRQHTFLQELQNRVRCFPTMRTIAERASLSVRSIRMAKQSLRDHGLLEWELRGRKHVYSFPDPEDPEPSILSQIS